MKRNGTKAIYSIIAAIVSNCRQAAQACRPSRYRYSMIQGRVWRQRLEVSGS